MKVVVITGSRRWRDREAIELALSGADAAILGDCPTGADAIALEVCKAWDIIPIVHAADWKTLGKRAGMVRNAEMVKRAVTERAEGMEVLAHAFPLEDSPGTRNCISQLQTAGFEVQGEL